MGETAQKFESTQEVEDLVCGMTSDSPETYISYEHEGKTFYFCSEYCIDMKDGYNQNQIKTRSRPLTQI